MLKIRWSDSERTKLHEEIFKVLDLKWPFDKKALRVVRSLFENPQVQINGGIDPMRTRTSSSAYEISDLKKYIQNRAVDESCEVRPVAPEVHEQITKAVEEGRIIDDRPVAATPSLPDVPELLLAAATPFSERMAAALNGLFPAAPTVEQHNGLLNLVRQILQQNINQQYLINELGEKLVSIESKLELVEALLDEFTTPGVETPAARIQKAVKATDKRPKIMIVGLLGHEMPMIANLYEHRFDMELLGQNPPRRTNFAGFDKVFVMTKRIGHPLYWSSKSKQEKDVIVHTNNGLRELKKAIEYTFMVAK